MPESNYVEKVNVGIEPEQVVVTHGSDGSVHTSFLYSLENWATISMIGWIPTIIAMIVLPPLVSAIFLLYFLLLFTGNSLPKGLNLIGGLAALYFLIDYHNGWFVSQIIGCFFSKKYQLWMLYGNMTLLMLHGLLLLFGRTLLKLSGYDKTPAIAYILGLGYLLHFVSRVIIDSGTISFIIKVI